MKKNPYPGKFIAFEGLDGSGQTTQVQKLRNMLEKYGKKVIITKEPTLDSQAGKDIRKILDHESSLAPKELQELFAKDREEHIANTIIPALSQGIWVISDRYAFSSFAYGAAHGTDLDWLIQRNEQFLVPDIAFLLQVRPEVCIQRIYKRGEPATLFEKEEQLRKVWGVYQEVMRRFDTIKIVDGEKTPDEVADTIWNILRQEFAL